MAVVGGVQMKRCRHGWSAVAVMALLVWLVPAAVGAEAADTAGAAALEGRDPPLLQPGDRARSAAAGSSRARCHRSPRPTSSCAPTSTSTSSTRKEAAIPDEWRAQGYVHVGDIDVVGNVRLRAVRAARLHAGSSGHGSVRRSNPAVPRCGRALHSTRTRSSPSIRRRGSPTRWITSTATRCCATTPSTTGSRCRRLKLSMLLEHTQGASIADGAVWISTSDAHNDIYRVNLKTGHVDLVAQITDPPGEGEGIAVAQLPSGYLHATVLDPDKTKVWVDHFSRPTVSK